MFVGLAASAALFGLYSRGGNAFVLGFVALVPWLLVLEGVPTAACVARSGLLMSIAFVAAVFAWFGVAIGAFTGWGSATGLLVLLVAAPFLQIQLIVFALVRHYVARRHGPILRTLAGASAWVATEWLVPRLFSDSIGHGLYPSPLLRQFADVGGVAGISFVLVIVNECVAMAITQRGRGVRRVVRPLLVATALPLLMSAYGVARIEAFKPTASAADKPLRIGMVQSNIHDYERLRREIGAYEVVRHVLDTHFAMSRDAIDNHRVDALLWSETVYPTTFAHPKSEGGAELDREILDFVSAAKVPLAFGSYDLDAAGEYNAAAFVEPTAGMLGFYRKTDLFPLTERVPAWLDGPTFRRWIGWAGTWTPGDGARVFPLRLADGREVPVLPMICLDDTDSSLAIDGARLGAQVILTMSNDSWFSDYPIGANLHLNVAAFRSIETRLPQMRVTANGVSAVIDATGAVLARTAMNKQQLLVGEVRMSQPQATLMLAWGDWVGRTAFAFLVLLALVSVASAWNRRMARRDSSRAASRGETGEIGEGFVVDVRVFTAPWRSAASALRVIAGLGLVWLGFTVLSGDISQNNPIRQLWMLAALVIAPAAAAWAIGRASSATLRIEGELLVLEQHARRIELRVPGLAAIEPWTVPLPSAGVSLRMASGRLWNLGIGIADPSALVKGLAGAGGRPELATALNRRASAYARVREAVSRWRIDHPVLKFVLFPLLPALPAFRLHQHIAYGGTFGEYYTFGLKAYLLALLVWWASWAIGMLLFAAALRVAIEAGTALAIVLKSERAIESRRMLEALGRLVYFVGIPAWLLVRILSG